VVKFNFSFSELRKRPFC